MTKYREILRLYSLGLSQQNIADNCGVSKKTVNRVLKRAKELNIHWPLDENDTDAALDAKFFPSSRQEFSKRAIPYCDFISQKRNVLVLGVTGAGKTFLANAIAADACRDGWHYLYIRLPDFFIEYANAAVLHKEFEILKKYQKASLLVLDEFLLIPADDNQQRILLELLERRYGRSSTIFCSQFSPEG